MTKRKSKSRISKKTNKNSAWYSPIAIVAFLIAIVALAISATSSGNFAGGAIGTGIVANSCNGDAVCETHKLQARGDITTLKDITAQGSITSNRNIDAAGEIKAAGKVTAKEFLADDGPIIMGNPSWYVWSNGYIGATNYLLSGSDIDTTGLNPGDIKAKGKIEGLDVNAAETITAGKSVTGSKIFADFRIQPTVLQGLKTIQFEKNNIKYKVTLKDVPSVTETIIEVETNGVSDSKTVTKGTGAEINRLGVFVEEINDISSSDTVQDTAKVFLGTSIRPVGNIESTGPIIATEYMQLDGCRITVDKLAGTLKVECPSVGGGGGA